MSTDQNFSLWLMPDDDSELTAQLQGEIDRLKDAHEGAPHFIPHVTLVGGVKGIDEAKARAATESLAASFAPLDVGFMGPACGPTYHQCVFLRCALTRPLSVAHGAARTAMNLPPVASATDYTPHLSLLYADVEEAGRAAIVDDVRERLYGGESDYSTLLVEPGFKATSLALWVTPAEDKALATWTELARFPFTGSG